MKTILFRNIYTSPLRGEDTSSERTQPQGYLAALRRGSSFFLIIYTISIFQASFLVHFNFSVVIPYITILAVLILNTLEKPDKKDGIYRAGILGFFWDIFSTGPIGFHLLLLAGLALLIKILLKNYFQPVIRFSAYRERP